MSDIFYPTEKRFYVKEDVSNNVTLRPTYPDLYGVTNPTASLSTTIDPEFLLSSVNLPPSPYYGGGELVGGSLKYYVNYVSGAHTAVTPNLKIYKALDTVTFSSGSFSPLRTGNIAAFSSYLDYNNPWMTEGFDGTNKGMGDREGYTKDTIRVTPAGVYEISGEDVLTYLDNMGYFSLTKRLKKLLARSRNAWEKVLQRDGPFALYKNPNFDDKYVLGAFHKQSNETTWLAFELKEKYASNTLENWKAAGAYENADSVNMSIKTYTSYDTDFVGKITQFNSIFNYVSEAMDVEDIKVQTVGTTGDETKVYTESAFNMTTADKLNGTSAGEMRNFYENLSGTALGEAEPSYAKVFGSTPGAAASGSSPYPQTVMAAMDYLPSPAQLEIGASGTSASTGPSTCQEIEVITKFNKMSPVLRTSGSNNFHFHRGFFMIFCKSAPRTDETFHQYILRIKNSVLPATGIWVYSTVGSQDETPTLRCVPFLDKSGSTLALSLNAADTHMPFSAFDSHTEFSDNITVPSDAWVTMRFKMDHRLSKILFYLPDSLDEKGAMKHMTLSTKDVNDTTGGVSDLNSMSLWLNNMRAISTSESATIGTSGYNPNMNQDIAGFEDDDMENSVLIDSINFKQYNSHYDNASVNDNNPTPSNLIIPPAPICVPTSSGSTITISGNASSSDNYYGSESTLTNSTLSFGFDTVDSSPFFANQLGLFLNDFGTANNQLVEAISGSTVADTWKSLKASFTASGNAADAFIGQPAYVQIGEQSAEEAAGTVLTTSPFTGSVEGFTQKGFIWVSSSSGAGPIASWAKRENPFVFARVLAANGDGTDIVVDKPEIFDLPLGAESEGGTDYIMWRPDIEYADAAAGTNWWAGSGNVGANNAFPSLNQRATRKGNLIYLNRATNIDDQTGQATTRGTGVPITMASYFPLGYNPNTDGATEWYDEAKLGSIYISPKKYWLNIHIVNATSDVWGDWYRPRESDAADKGFFNYKNIRHKQRHYGTVIATTAPASTSAGTFGSSNNESLYTDGVPTNTWNTGVTPEGIFNVSTDYGFGVFVEPGEGEIGQFGGFINKSVPKASTYNYINLDAYVKENSPAYNSTFNFGMIPFVENTYSYGTYDINIDTVRGTKPPCMFWAFESQMPEISNFKVESSNQTITPENIDTLLQPDSTNINFNWQENSDNTWYRLLWVDSELIQSKYHKANFIAPLNENPGVDSNFYLYSSSAEYVSQTNAVAIGSNTPSSYSNIEGFQGYGFSGSVALTTATSTLTLGSASEYTMLCHLKPSTTGTIINAITTDVADSSQFTLRLESNKKLRATMNASGTTLTSTTAYDVDGIQPLAVAITYNKSLDNNNFKMYVNGTLEDTADYTTNFTNTSLKLHLGDASYTGFLEEVSWHTKAAYIVPNAGSFSLPTKSLPDLTGTASNKYQSRLFLMDYHNIRGASPQDVTRSNTAAWKITGV